MILRRWGLQVFEMKSSSHLSESNPEHLLRVISVLAETCVIPNGLGLRAHFEAVDIDI